MHLITSYCQAQRLTFFFLLSSFYSCLSSFTRRQRQTALLYERRHQAHQQQEVAAAQAAEAEKKKTSRKKKKSTDEAEEEEDEPAGITRPPKVAHGLMPEYALADLIYVLSYNPQFNDHIGLVRNNMFDMVGVYFVGSVDGLNTRLTKCLCFSLFCFP